MSIRSGRRARSDRSKAQVSLGDGGEKAQKLFRELTDDVVQEHVRVGVSHVLPGVLLGVEPSREA